MDKFKEFLKGYKKDYKTLKKLLANPTKKQKVLGIAAIAVVVIIIVLLFVPSLGFKYVREVKLPDLPVQVYEDLYIPGTLQEEFGKGGQKECTFTHIVNEFTIVEGILQYDNARVSLETVTKPTQEDLGEPFTNYVVSDALTAYAWRMGVDSGLTLPVHTEDEDLLRTGLYIFGEVNYGINLLPEFECSDWVVDESRFELPSDVEFSDPRG
jgi:hypothetical protein